MKFTILLIAIIAGTAFGANKTSSPTIKICNVHYTNEYTAQTKCFTIPRSKISDLLKAMDLAGCRNKQDSSLIAYNCQGRI